MIKTKIEMKQLHAHTHKTLFDKNSIVYFNMSCRFVRVECDAVVQKRVRHLLELLYTQIFRSTFFAVVFSFDRLLLRSSELCTTPMREKSSIWQPS